MADNLYNKKPSVSPQRSKASPSSLSIPEDRDKHGHDGSTRTRLMSSDSVLEDDVFFTSHIPMADNHTRNQAGDGVFHCNSHSRCDSGFSSTYVGSSISTNSEPRLSTRSWHTISPSNRVQTDTSKTKTNSKLQKQKHHRSITSFFSKHLTRNSSYKTSSKASFAEEKSAVVVWDGPKPDNQNLRTVLDKQQPRANKVQLDHAENIDHNQEISSVDISAMLNALKLLELRVQSGQFIPHPGQEITFGTCAVGFFDSNGGRLTLPSLGIVLLIPRGAIQSKGPQMIYIYALPSERNEPDIDIKETWLTPTVECGPSGLQFAKELLLSMPHCAIDHPQWKVQVQRGNDDSSEWKKLETGKDTMVFLDDKKITVALNHFSPYKVSGRSSSSSDEESFVKQWMKVAVFPKDLTTSDEVTTALLKFRLCKLQDWKMVLQEERINDTTNISSESIPVTNNGVDIVIRIKDHNPLWEIEGSVQQHIQFNDVWCGYEHAFKSGRLAVPIQLKTTSSTDAALLTTSNGIRNKQSLCTVEVSQTEEAVVELHASIPEVYSDGQQSQGYTISKKNLEEEICREMENRFLAQQQYLNPGSHCLTFLNDVRYRRICTALDGANNVEKGWSAFASAMRVGRDILIQGSLQTWSQCQGRSPSALLLDFFFHDNYDMDQLDALKMLSSLFLDIENHTAKAMVDDEIEERVRGSIVYPADYDVVFGVEESREVSSAACSNQYAETAKDAHVGAKSKHRYSQWAKSFKAFMSDTFKTKKREIQRETDLTCASHTEMHGNSYETANNLNSLPEYRYNSRIQTSNSLPRTGPSTGSTDLKLETSLINNTIRKNSSSPDVCNVSSILKTGSKNFNRQVTKDSGISRMSSQHSVSSKGTMSCTTDASDTNYQTADRTSPIKRHSRHGTNDSGVYSQRGSSRTNSSSVMY